MASLTIPITTTSTMQGIYVHTNQGELYFVSASVDPDPINPHEDYGVTEIVTTNNRYFHGDTVCHYPESIVDLRRAEGNELVALPLFLYVHGGMVLSLTPFGDPWDSCQVGYVICTKQSVMDAYGSATDWEQHAKEIIQQEINAYNVYLAGECYTYDVYAYDPATKAWQWEDGCSGFQSDDDNDLFSAFFRAEDASIISEQEAGDYQ